MNSLTIVALVLSAVVVGLLGFAAEEAPAGVEAAPAVAADRKVVVRGNNAFALDLYGRLRRPGDDLFFSPASLSTALAMAYLGARGETAAQMAKVLHLDLGPDRLEAAFADLLRGLSGGDGRRAYELHMANALWGQAGYGFLPDYLKAIRDHFGAGLMEVDYRDDPDAARATINAWVERQTNERIKDLIPPRVLDRQTRLVLTNAVYFKGAWVRPFQRANTRPAPFHEAGGRQVDVPLMAQTGRFGYLDGGTFQALELPYLDRDRAQATAVGAGLSMVVLLPKAVDGLEALETSLSAEGLEGLLARLRTDEVVVALPRFTMTEQFRLGRTLAAMGMPLAFSAEADFSGMDGRTHDLALTEAIHKAFVDVNEEGTEAAAATAIAVGLTAAMPRPKPVFRADRPFLFLIRDGRSGSLLFLGRVARAPAP